MEVKTIYHNIHDTWDYDGNHHVYPKKVHDTREEAISKPTKEECFKEYYRLNNSLRYCNGMYYTFANESDNKEYNEWYKSLSESKKFDMYYSGGIVD